MVVFCTGHFQMNCLDWKVVIFKNEISLKYFLVSIDNRPAIVQKIAWNRVCSKPSNKRQVIIWTYDDLNHWRIYALLGLVKLRLTFTEMSDYFGGTMTTLGSIKCHRIIERHRNLSESTINFAVRDAIASGLLPALERSAHITHAKIRRTIDCGKIYQNNGGS